MTAEALKERLERGPFSGFQVLTTPHYLIFYQSKRPFAQRSARLLEDLYRGLIDFFHQREGETVFLCWKLGESQVDWWHPVDTGIAGRQRL